ncbi:AAA family ATPase [Patescibacteria group bacterium]|nr:AAA family ATPase [Patescibacteria group bacterium]
MYNWKIIGHKKQIGAIEEDMKADNLTHAYLFAGPSGIGKFAIAKMFVNILQCPNNLCHECPTCIQIQKDGHPDTIVLKDTEESIKIEQIREIITKLNMTAQGKYKVLLIKKAERMTPEAANCLLKTLEEPPANTLIVMTTDNARLILPTIISRVRLLKFNAYSTGFLEEKLADLFPDTNQETLKQICSLSLGKSGKAIKLLRNADLLASYRTMYNVLCEFLEDTPIYRKFNVIEEVLKEKKDVNEFLDTFTHLIRNRLYQGVSDGSNKDKEQYLISLLEEVENTKTLLSHNVNAKLALENLALKTIS